MDNPVSFDLNLAIQHWRENLAQSPAFRSENLNELESHLRDSIATLQTRGLSAEEAFMVATKRIGMGDSLGMEFTKVNGQAVWFDRTLWALIGFQISMVAFDFCRIVSAVCAILTKPMYRMYREFTGGGIDRSLMAIPVLALPLTTAVLALIVWKVFQGPKSHARTAFSKLLKQPLALAFSFLWLGILVRLVAMCAFEDLVFGPSRQSVTATGLLMQLPQYALCAMLTMFVARKRIGIITD